MRGANKAALLAGVGAALMLSGCAYSEMATSPASYTDIMAADDYMWIDRAESLWETIGEAPPDHAFDFHDAEPWAWVLEDGHTIIVEEDGKGFRTYYYAPGAEEPFLAVEPGRSFAFDGERVIVAYGPDGHALPRSGNIAELDGAGALYARGRDLIRAMRRNERRSVDAGIWYDSSPFLWNFIQLWDDGLQSNRNWRNYRNSRPSYDWRRHFDDERRRREGLSDAFRRWREGGFQGSPPARWRAGPRPDQPGTTVPRQPGQGRWNRGPRPTPNGQVPPGAAAPPTQGRWNRGPRPTPNGQVAPSAAQPWQNRWNRTRPAPDAAPVPGQPTPETPRRWTRPTPNGQNMPDAGRPGWQGRRSDVEPGQRPERPEGWTPAAPSMRPDRGASGDGGRGSWRGGSPSSGDGTRGSWRGSAPSSGGFQRPEGSTPRAEVPRSEPRVAPPPPPPPPPPPSPPPSTPAPSLRADDTAPN